MGRRFAAGKGTARAWAVALAAVAPWGGPALAAEPMPPSRDVLEWHELHLGRAALEHSLGNPRGVIEHLESLDYSVAPRFAEADRAAFLLGQAYLRVGSFARFARLARWVSGWERRSPYTEWLAFQLLAAETEGSAARPAAPHRAGTAPPDSVPPPAAGAAVADALAAGLLLRDGDPEAALRLLTRVAPPRPALVVYLEALALAAAGRDDGAALDSLARADTLSALGRELAGLALLRLAARARARGEDAGALLAAVPGGSRFASRARHMRGLAALERGDGAEARRILESLRADSTYGAGREVGLALAGQLLDAGQWEPAHRAYGEIDRDWTARRDTLQALLAAGRAEEVWASWESASLSDALVLDALPARMLAERMARAAADLTSHGAAAAPVLDGPPPARGPWEVAPPGPEERRAVAAAMARAREAADALERSRRAAEDERGWLADLRRYLAHGAGEARQERDTLAVRTAYLDSLASTLEALDARLRSVRDAWTSRVTGRARAVLAAAERHLGWLGTIRHLFVEGPHRERPVVLPEGFPTPDSLTRAELELARAVHELGERLLLGAPDLIERSYQHAWRPLLVERTVASRTEAHRLAAWARAVGPEIESGLAGAASSEALAAFESRTRRLARAADSLRAASDALRGRVAGAAVERALADLEGEREAIDYGLAASAYALGMRLPATSSDTAVADTTRTAAGVAGRDSLDATGVAAGAAGRDSLGGDERDDPETVAWRARAIEALRVFLARHPRSAARGEMRFRLADALFADARHDFRERMAGYLRDQAEGRARGGPPPVMDQAPALALYRAMLREDRDFPHRDAVLFNAGMLLADEGDPEAGRLFAELIEAHPRSRYVQEACLRMGDLEFNEKRFAASVPLYRRAAAGDDPTLRAMALYKMGWAHFNGERLSEAAEAFREVLDLYQSAPEARIQVDVEGEAESYLVHTLARAGGARAFAEHFDRVGARPYERKVLRGLGHHFRRYSLFAEAAAADELYLDRYPLDADAPLGAQRLAETYKRWERPALARRARLEYAPRFAPGSVWWKAQASDSVRAAGAAFARAAWRSVALDHHRDARAGGSRADWAEALRLHETLLSHWPDDPEAAAHRLYAGEASARLGRHRAALDHYALAARSGADSVASEAAFQQVVVTDAWYEEARAGGSADGLAPPGDSLARAVLAAGDTMRARFPEHPATRDVLWRQGHVALAHGWLERAAQDFERLAARFPDDRRAPLAAGLRADALFRSGDFESAGAAFEAALALARRAGSDSLARRAAEAIPVCYYRHAEAAAAADSTRPARYAPLFERVAARWPEYPHAHLAQYRGALAYLAAGMVGDGVRAMEELIRRFPSSEYVKDAGLHIARAWEGAGEPRRAAEAYFAFAERHPQDPSASGAWLKAADLFAAAGHGARAEELRLGYLRRFPDDAETAFEVLEPLARRELKGVRPSYPVSMLLKVGVEAPVPSHLSAYLERAQKRPDLASRELLAEVRFLQGEEARAAYLARRLSLPLEKSIPAKQRLLDSLIAPYRRGVDVGPSEWADGALFRIGEALVEFGKALEESDRPADLEGDDLRAYGDVLREQAQAFYDRGEGVWTELLRQKPRGGPVNPWIAQTQAALWQRLADRFSYLPETDFPLVAPAPPERAQPGKQAKGAKRAPRAAADSARRAPGEREGREP